MAVAFSAGGDTRVFPRPQPNPLRPLVGKVPAGAAQCAGSGMFILYQLTCLAQEDEIPFHAIWKSTEVLN